MNPPWVILVLLKVSSCCACSNGGRDYWGFLFAIEGSLLYKIKYVERTVVVI